MARYGKLPGYMSRTFAGILTSLGQQNATSLLFARSVIWYALLSTLCRLEPDTASKVRLARPPMAVAPKRSAKKPTARIFIEYAFTGHVWAVAGQGYVCRAVLRTSSRNRDATPLGSSAARVLELGVSSYLPTLVAASMMTSATLPGIDNIGT